MQLLKELGPPRELDDVGMASLDHSLWVDIMSPRVAVTGVGCCMMTSTTLWVALSDEAIWERLFQVFVAPRCGQPPSAVSSWQQTVQRRWLHSCMLNVTTSGGIPKEIDLGRITMGRCNFDNGRNTIWEDEQFLHSRIEISCGSSLRAWAFDPAVVDICASV